MFPPRLLCLAFLLVLTNVAPAQAAPQFQWIQMQLNREAELRLAASNTAHLRIETSTNLREWSPFLTVQSTGTLQHTDTAAPFLTGRYYRAFHLTNTAVVTGDHIATTNGDVLIRAVSHGSVVLQWNGKMIYADPVSTYGSFTGLPPADVILVTHTHTDHLHVNTINAVKTNNTVILAPQAVYNTGGFSALRPLTTVLTNGMATNLLGLTIEAVPMYNVISTSFHPRGVGNGYVLTLGGRRFYISGDTEDTPEMRVLPNIEVAFVAINQPFTMTVAQASSAVRQMRPRVVYPYHFRNSDNSLSDLAAFKQQVGTDLGIEVRFRKWY